MCGAKIERDQFIVLLGAASGRLRSEPSITLRKRRRTTMTGSNEDGGMAGKEREGRTEDELCEDDEQIEHLFS